MEKLLLLFNRFEGVGGVRDRRASDQVNLVMRSVTPESTDRPVELQGKASGKRRGRLGGVDLGAGAR